MVLPDYETLNPIGTLTLDTFNIANRDYHTPLPGVPSGTIEWYGAEWIGTLKLPQSGAYSFKANSDDGIQFFIDGYLILEADGVHGLVTAQSPPIQFNSGDHLFHVKWFQGPKHFIALELFWKKPGTSSFDYIPKDNWSAPCP